MAYLAGMDLLKNARLSNNEIAYSTTQESGLELRRLRRDNSPTKIVQTHPYHYAK